MRKTKASFKVPVSPVWGGSATLVVEPTASGGYVLEVRPCRSRTRVRADLGLLAEIVLERDAKGKVLA